MGTSARQHASRDPLYDTVSQAARRLTIGVPTLHRLINAKVIPVQTFNGRRKIAKLVVGQLLASAYDIWSPERRPRYSLEGLRRLSGITVETVAAQVGLGRTAGYQAVRNQQIPATKLPNSDRWIVPADVVAQMETYDLGNLATEPNSGEPYRSLLPHAEVENAKTDAAKATHEELDA